ncbi:CD1375 family protein [Enterococcus sp. DIV0800]
MVKVYLNLIEKGVKTIDDVPEKIKEEVQAILSANSAD